MKPVIFVLISITSLNLFAQELVDAPIRDLVQIKAQALTAQQQGVYGMMWGEAAKPLDSLLKAVNQAREAPQPAQGSLSVLPSVSKLRAAEKLDKTCVTNWIVTDTGGYQSQPILCTIQSLDRESFRKELQRMGYVLKTSSIRSDSGDAVHGATFVAMYSSDGKLRFFSHQLNVTQ